MTDRADKQAAYQAWAERMKQNKEALKEEALGTPAPEELNPMWSTEALFRGDAVVDIDAAEQAHIAELLATLGLPPDASLEQARAAHTSLTREVHPDSHTDATVRTQARNIGKLIEINAAYKELEELLGAGS